MKIIHLPLIFLLFCGCDCIRRKEEPKPTKPELTTDGRNTFYCEINGVPYHQKFLGGQPLFPKIIGGYSLIGDIHYLDIRIHYSNRILNENISIFITEKDISSKIYFMNKFNSYAVFRSKNSGCYYSESVDKYNSFDGNIKFERFDPINYIFSGTFEFKNWLPDSIKGHCDTIKVTNGIFDLKL
jgi:hypothetical protein